MPKLRPAKPAAIVRKLRQLGFEGPFGGGRHPVMRHPRTGQKISVPMHKDRDLTVGTLWAIVRAAGICVEERSVMKRKVLKLTCLIKKKRAISIQLFA